MVYNHTAEGNHLGPTLSFKGIDNPAYYRLVEDDQQLLHGLHGHRQLPQRAAPALAAADHGLAALLGHRDARRRLPLRPRLDPGPRVLRRRPAVDVLRARAAGPGRQPGQADRRAVGRRPRRLPGRQLPAAVDRVERRLPRHRPRLLARRAVARRVRLAGSPARPTSTSTPAAGRSPASTSSPPTTASRCATWCPTTRSTTRPTARTTTTARATTAPGTTASRDRPTTPRSWRCGPASSATSSPRCCSARACRCSLHGDELGRTQHGNNNTYAQDSEISWVHWDEADQPLIEFTAAVARLRREHPTFRRKRFFTGTHRAHRRRRAAQRHRLAAPRRPADGGRRLGRAGRKAIGMYLNGHGIAGTDARGGPDHRRPLPALLQRRRRRRGDPAAGGVRRARGTCVIDTGGAADDEPHARRPVDDVRGRAPGRRRAPRARRARGRARPLRRRVRRRAGRRRVADRSDPHAGATDHADGRTSTYRLQITEDFDLFEAAAACCPTCTTSASTGSTSRRCSPPSRAATTATTWSPSTGSTRPAAAPTGWPRCPQEARRLGHGRARRHRAQPRRRRHARGRTPGGGTCSSTARTRAYADAFDIDWAAGGGRLRIPVLGDDDLAVDGGPIGTCGSRRRAALPRPPLPARARHARRRPGRTVHDASTTSWSAGGAADADLNYRRFFAVNTLAAVRVEDPRGLRRVARRDRRVVRRGPGRRAAGRPPRRPARPGGYLDDLAGADRRRLRAGREDPRARRGAAARRGRPPAPPGTTRSRSSTGCSPTRPARRRSTARGPAARRARRLARADPRHQARRRRRHPALRGPADRAASCRGRDWRERARRPTAIEDAVAELLACFPVYRSYLPEGREHLDQALARARTHRPDLADDARRPRAGARRPGATRPRCASSRPAAW